MTEQTGFDFGREGPLCSFIQPAGTWLVAEFTAEEHAARLTAAEACAAVLAPVLRPFYMRGIRAARVELERRAPHMDSSEVFGLHAITVTATCREVDELQRQDLAALGIEHKTRRAAATEQMQALYAPGVGTITVRPHTDGSRSIGFAHYRNSDMLPSYRDCQPVYELPEAVWGPTYACQAIAEAGEGIASVKTYRHGGREWINDGGMYFSGNASCEAWAITRRAYWDGETYSYRDQVKAWDAGTLERGDRRGLVVKVRGIECVLTSAATFTDYRPAAQEPQASGDRVAEWEPGIGSRVRARRKCGIGPFDNFPLLVKKRDVVASKGGDVVLFTCETTGPVTRKTRRNGSTYTEFPQWQGFYEAGELEPDLSRA